MKKTGASSQTRSWREIHLDATDLFKVVRGLVYGNFKAIRKTSDLFGEELALTPESRLDAAPLSLEEDELKSAAMGVAGFFTLDGARVDDLCRRNTLGEWAEVVLRFWGNRGRFITFFTSGSTGSPKAIKRHYELLEQDASFMASLHEGAGRILALIPPNHIYGFISCILIPKVLGVACEDKRFMMPTTTAEELRPGDLIVATPFHWKLFAQHVERFPSSIRGFSSGAACPPEVMKSLYAKGMDKIVEIYGSSECGAMGYRSAPCEPLTLAPTWERIEEEAFARRFSDSSMSEPFCFQDRLTWVDEKRFFTAGRIDNAVQVAGINVYPGKVAEVIRQCDLVEDCCVRLMRHDEGERLKAFVVLKRRMEPTAEVKKVLQDHLAKHLNHLEQPKSLSFGLKLPTNDMGKPADW